jgi:probable rRNA maturation factor
VLRAERVAAPLSVSVVITNDATIRDLNRRFRQQDRATDVLSFQLDSDPQVVSLDRVKLLGEIVISMQTARRQARTAGHSVDDELAHLLVHGVLHLLGYDHERPRDAKQMREREEDLLGPHVH